MSSQSTRKPPQNITCGGCDTTWTGVSRCHCAGCHHTFGGLSLFDQHRKGGRCADPATLTDGGEPLRLVDGIWRGPTFDATGLFGSDAA